MANKQKSSRGESSSRHNDLIRCENCGRESRYMRRGKAVDLLLRGRGRALRCTGCDRSSFKLFVGK